MNKAALNYKLYQFMLEGRISPRQRQKLVEVGFLDKITSWLGGGVEVGKSLGKAIADKAHQKQFDAAKKDITKGVEELKAVASKAGISDEDVALFLKGVLDGAGAPDASEIASAKPSDDGGGKAGEGDGTKPGTPIDPGKEEEAVPTIAGAAAEASGQDPEKAKEQAEEKKVDVPKASKVLAAAVAKQADAKPDVAAKIIDWLLQNKHLQAESGRRPTAADILRAAQSSLRNKKAQDSMNGGVIIERWQKLAGLLKEEGEKADPKVEKAKKQFGDFLEDITKALGVKEDDTETQDQIINILIALDELESIQIK